MTATFTTPAESVASANPHPVLIGTAGHIDHGKTTLVLKLTGVNTDRLPEEQARGISIDLGFAHFDHGGFRFGIVDVPGHERFIRQMVAGAANIDLALFVVAADDGVMPQTREHLEILQLLGVRFGVVAITRSDLVDAEMIELVTEELRELVAPTFLAESPIVAVSSVTGAGLDELRATLGDVAAMSIESGRRSDAATYFRMPIDRVFTLPGRGTIVTGSVLCGEVSVGDEVELLPTTRAVRVRSVQHHGTAVEHAGAHRRAAINLAGVSLDDVHRGDELVTTGVLKPTQRFLCRIQALANVRRSLRHRQVLTLHAGTTAVTARLRLPSGNIAAGETGFADLRLKEPIVLTRGQHFILRTSGSQTVGGGSVLDPLPGRRRVRDLDARCEAADGDAFSRLSMLLENQPASNGAEFVQRLNLTADEVRGILSSMNKSDPRAKEVVVDSASGRFVHVAWLERMGRSLMRIIREELMRQAPKRLLPRAAVISLCSGFEGAELVPLVLKRLEVSGDLVARGDLIGPGDLQVALTKRQREVLDVILPLVQQQSRTPPTHKELCAATDRMAAADVEQLIRLCHQDGSLILVAPDLSYAPPGLEELQRDLAALFHAKPEVTLAEIRDALKMTRKHVVPLAEYWDKIRVTIRSGDFRKRGPELV